MYFRTMVEGNVKGVNLKGLESRAKVTAKGQGRTGFIGVFFSRHIQHTLPCTVDTISQYHLMRRHYTSGKEADPVRNGVKQVSQRDNTGAPCPISALSEWFQYLYVVNPNHNLLISHHSYERDMMYTHSASFSTTTLARSAKHYRVYENTQHSYWPF